MRQGPNRVGPAGLLQPLADGIKFIFKEDITPLDADKFLYTLAPVASLVPALMAFVMIPFGGAINLPYVGEIQMHITRVNVAVLVILGMTGMGVYGIVLAGYEDEHADYMPPTWRVMKWKANASFQSSRSNGANQTNRHKERLWFSPHCLRLTPTLFEAAD
jgi:hypothetical protein